MDMLLALGIFAVFIAALWFALRSPSLAHHPDEPQVWRSAKLVYAEKLFRAPRLGLVARIDRAYLVDGQVELVELKTRPSGRVHVSDIIELSVQRVVLQERTGESVSRRGWVLIEHVGTGRRRPMSVMLYDEEEVLRLRDRARVLRADAEVEDLAALRGPSSPRACEKCGQRSRCTARLA